MKKWFLALVLAAATPALAEDDGPTAADLKTSFKQFGTSVVKLGKAVGTTAKDAGVEVGHAAKKVGKDVGQAAKTTGKEVKEEGTGVGSSLSATFASALHSLGSAFDRLSSKLKGVGEAKEETQPAAKPEPSVSD